MTDTEVLLAELEQLELGAVLLQALVQVELAVLDEGAKTREGDNGDEGDEGENPEPSRYSVAA